MADAAALVRSTQAPAPRVVPDSSIRVDILTFGGAVARSIRATLGASRLDVIINPACREELRRVLGYPQLTHYVVDAQVVFVWVDHMTRSVADPEDAARVQDEAFVPRCRGRDDQEFLALADAANVVYLVSKDRTVLKLKCRMVEYYDAAALSPEQLVALIQSENAPLATIPDQA